MSLLFLARRPAEAAARAQWRSVVCPAALCLAALAAPSETGAADLKVLGDASSQGLFGLEVSPGPACTVDHLSVPPGTVNTDQVACLSVTAVNVQVTSPGATFTAGSSIALGNQFSVAAGASFAAVIDAAVSSLSAFVQDDTPSDDATYNALFDLRHNALTLNPGEEIGLLNGYAANGDLKLRLILRFNDTLMQKRLALAAWDDSTGSLREHSSDLGLGVGVNTIYLSWRAGAGDGQFLVSVSSAPLVGLTDLDNATSRVDYVRWGAVDGVVAPSSGSVDLDTFSSWRLENRAVETELPNFEPAQNDHFGARVKVDGDTLVVGAPLDNPAAGADAGSVYVYVRDGASWTFLQKLTPNDPAAGDRFGNSVSIDGDYIAVGASRDDDQGIDSGSAYIFKRTGTSWSQHAKILAWTAGDSSDNFGAAIALDSSIPGENPGAGEITTLVVGAPDDEADQFGCCAGGIYIYELSGDGTAWNPRHYHFASDAEMNAEFGAAVAIDGDGIAVGSPEWAGGGPGTFGKAYIFQRRGLLNTWGQDFAFESSDPHSGDRFGNSVGIVNLFGNYHVVVGVPNADEALVGFNTGAVFVFFGNTNLWQEQILVSSEMIASVRFGDAVDINDGLIVVGEPRLDAVGTDTGAIHVFRLDPLGQTWHHTGRLLSSNLSGASRLGDRVGVSGSTVVGAAPNEPAGPSPTLVGEVAVFDLMLNIFSDGFESGDTSVWSSKVP